MRKVAFKTNFVERFTRKYKIKADTLCSEWIGWKDGGGYGVCTKDGKEIKAHRASYMLWKGKIPEGMCVCHTCDNPLCVNPDHLFLGTHLENMQDKMRKGRGPKKGVIPGIGKHGSEHPLAKLNEAQVKEIKIKLAAGMLGTTIARQYGVIDQTIYEIKNGKNWKQVTID